MVSNMSYARIVDGRVAAYPCSPDAVRRDNPNVSFPAVITDAMLAQYNIFPVQATPKPACNWFERVEEVNPVSEDGVWVQRWQVTALGTAERTALVEGQWAAMRAERNARLARSDWTQLADSQADKAAWAAYRQALRDLPQMAGNPFGIVWPEEPR